MGWLYYETNIYICTKEKTNIIQYNKQNNFFTLVSIRKPQTHLIYLSKDLPQLHSLHNPGYNTKFQ